VRFERAVRIVILSVSVSILFFILVVEKFKPNPHYSPTFYQWGRECEHRCSLEKQKWYYQKAIYHDPVFSNAYYQLATLYEQEGDDNRALELYKRVTELDFQNYKAYFKVAVDYFRGGQYDDAERYFTQAIRYKHNFLEAYYYMGRIYVLKKDYKTAVWHFQHGEYVENVYFLENCLRMGVAYSLWGSEPMASEYVNKLRDLGEHNLADQLEQYVLKSQYPEYLSKSEERTQLYNLNLRKRMKIMQ